ncbi:MAG: response regulator [Cyclobacteriaceae bacterium]|nr:response regulator [Cyclobacteriaceae bacterium]
MLKAIIIDDEKNSRNTLRNFLEKYCKQIQIVAEAEGVNSGLVQLAKFDTDVVFLDIQMQDGTGFDLLDKIQKNNFKIIFVTAYDEYAIRAFKYSAMDYLLKPIHPDRLVEAVNKLDKDLNLLEFHQKLEVLISNKSNIEKIALPSSDGVRLVRLKNIVRCVSDSNYTTIYLQCGEKIVVTKTLKEYEELLSHMKFYRIHKSHLINMNYIDRYVQGEGGYVIMEDGSQVEVSRRRREHFLDILMGK